jgi:hypothetical protein
MYKVVSLITDLPYGHRDNSLKGDHSHIYSVQWFKRHESEGLLTGLSKPEADKLKDFLDKNCKGTFKKNEVEATNENEIPHESVYPMPENSIPKFYPFEDLKTFGIIKNIPFTIDLMGHINL